MSVLSSDPPANILEARPWLIAFNEAALSNIFFLGNPGSLTATGTIGNVSYQRFSGAGSQTLTLPPANDGSGKSRVLYLKNTGTNAVTIARAGSDVIVPQGVGDLGTVTSYSLAAGGNNILVSNGNTQWVVMSAS